MSKRKGASFCGQDPQSHESENVWFTPREYNEKLGPFDMDPCTVSWRPFDTAECHVLHDKGGDGLKIKWYGDVWLNPPYGKQIGPFIDKFAVHRKGVMLIFARMGSEHVQKILKSDAFCYCLRKRIFFIQKDGKKVTNAGTDSLLVFYDRKYIPRVMKFDGVLIQRSKVF